MIKSPLQISPNCENWNEAMLQNVIFTTARPFAVVSKTALGFALGYGVREAMSRYRRARERRKYTGL